MIALTDTPGAGTGPPHGTFAGVYASSRPPCRMDAHWNPADSGPDRLKPRAQGGPSAAQPVNPRRPGRGSAPSERRPRLDG
jgi:hypothetical protein